VTLRHAKLNRAIRVYRADQYIYKFQQLIVGPRFPSEHQLGGRSSLFVDLVVNDATDPTLVTTDIGQQQPPDKMSSMSTQGMSTP
jgi:hypothetical protein